MILQKLFGLFSVLGMAVVFPASAQNQETKSLVFSADLESFRDLNGLKSALSQVEIVALGENTHGLGEVFKAKTELVKFLHEELDFNIVLLESGFGDAALAWEQIEHLSAPAYTRIFSSNFYYQSEEMEALVEYAQAQHGDLIIQGIDCQPQQDYLIDRMADIGALIDTAWRRITKQEMRGFSYLYQHEMDQDSISFYARRNRFVQFLDSYDDLLREHEDVLQSLGITSGEIHAIRNSNDQLRNTYETVEMGEMLSWPAAYSFRDAAMLHTVQWYREQFPGQKIIIWAQNSHVENRPKPDYTVSWMGHGLHNLYQEKYYSIGAVVYSGTDLTYSGTFQFEHNDPDYLAYHLNLSDQERYVLDLRGYSGEDFTGQLLLGMENNGATASFIAKDRFDGLLFIRYSDVPVLLRPVEE